MDRHTFFDRWGVHVKGSVHGAAAEVKLLRLFIDDLDDLVAFYLKEGSKTAHIEVASLTPVTRRTR